MRKIAFFAVMTALAAASQAQVINEFVANHTGTDTNEFVEIFGSASTDYSGLMILHIEGDTTGAGIIDSIYQVGTTDANGFWTTGFLSNGLENGTISLLLVSGFTGTTGTDLDTNNDGVLDSTPWTTLLDAVAVSDGGSGDWGYGGVVLTPSFDGGSFTVGGASRIPNGVDTDSTSDWMRNDFDGYGLSGFGGTPDPGEAVNTPGTFNQPVPEPASMIALGIGALGLLARRRRAQ